MYTPKNTTCRWCNEVFNVSAEEQSFLVRVSPTINNHILNIPLPTLCPTCRTKRRLAFRNERTLYRDTCDLCGKDMLSIFSPDKPNRVYCHECWWSDSWDPYHYGREINLSRDFFPQFQSLLNDIPFPALSNSNNENCDYVNQTANLKNCYLVFGVIDAQDCLYGLRMRNGVSCIDGLLAEYSELAYECVSSNKIYRGQFLEDCSGCSDAYFLYDCRECRDCILCWNLRGKQYCIENKQYSREEYFKKRADIFMLKRTYSGLESLKKHFRLLIKTNAAHRDVRQQSCEASFGDNLHNCREARNCYQCGGLDQCAHLVFVNESKDVVDANNCDGAELCYECSTAGVDGYHLLFSIDAWPGMSEVLYSYFSPYSKNMFGCACVKRGSFSILNRQYSKEEYESLVPKIVSRMRASGEWGEFFSPHISPWGYNETCAQEWLPSTEDAVKKLGFNWCSYLTPASTTSKTVEAKDMPDSIDNVGDEILRAVIRCQESGRMFRITKFELAWYRSEGLPIPRLHPEERHKKRLAKIPPRKLVTRSCIKCGDTTLSALTHDTGLEVMSKECYEHVLY